MAVNVGLAIGLSMGLGIPLTVALIILAVTYGRRRHPRLPKPDACETQATENWLNLYHATRPRIKHPPKLFLSIVADRNLAESFLEKIRSILESLRLLRKPVVQEVYMMEDGAKVSKK
ncbi:unnamed protein product [Penicillium camemberti]|uniref:Str. FM013 n=1 Tax=Penicillium camemberti (strain FM 013) TaxID=1429867 RepID=A0A0G4PE37_PENC3|nr:unnamed protein product [Penicillium camemberti]